MVSSIVQFEMLVEVAAAATLLTCEHHLIITKYSTSVYTGMDHIGRHRAEPWISFNSGILANEVYFSML